MAGRPREVEKSFPNRAVLPRVQHADDPHPQEVLLQSVDARQSDPRLLGHIHQDAEPAVPA